MRRVLATEAAIFAELEPLGRGLLVLRRAVVAALTLGARERDDVSHVLSALGAHPQRPCPRALFPMLVGPHPHSLSLAPSRSLGPQAPAARHWLSRLSV